MDVKTIAERSNDTTPPYQYPIFMEDYEPLWAALVAFIVCLYVFLALEVICKNYLIPSVERLRFCLNLSYDVTSGTIMALSTSVPAICVHLISTFLTCSDMGIGTVLGAAIFNSLGLYACCGLAPGVNMSTDWWIITRDVIFFLMSLAVLSYFVHNGKVYWYEALIMVAVYFVDIVYLTFDRHIEDWVRGPFADAEDNYIAQPKYGRKSRMSNSRRYTMAIDSSIGPIENTISTTMRSLEGLSTISSHSSDEYKNIDYCWCFTPTGKIPDMKPRNYDPDDDPVFFFNFRKSPIGVCRKFMWILQWPLNCIYFFTIPDCRHASRKRLFILTWLLSIAWMSVLSYVLSWMVTILAHNLNLPDTILGLTVLAVGTKMPETIAVVLETLQGHQASGVCSSTIDILICLGAPWTIKALLAPKVPGDSCVIINSPGIKNVACILVIAYLYFMLMFTRFTVGRTLGWLCLLGYIAFVAYFSYTEEVQKN